MQEDCLIEIESQAELGVGAARCGALSFVAGFVGCWSMRGVSVGFPVNVVAAGIVVGEQDVWSVRLCCHDVFNRPGHG